MGAKFFSGLFMMCLFVSNIGCKKDKPSANEVSQVKAKQKAILSMTSFDEVEVDDILDIVVESDAEQNKGGIITYLITAETGAGSATIDKDGVLKALQEGAVSVIATSSGDENYLPAFVSKIITIIPKPAADQASASTRTGGTSSSKPETTDPTGSSAASTDTKKPLKKDSTPTKVTGSEPSKPLVVVNPSPVSEPEKGRKPLPIPTSTPIHVLRTEPILLSADQMSALSVLTVGHQHQLVVQNLEGRHLRVEKISGEGEIDWNGNQIIGKKKGFLRLKITAERSNLVEESFLELSMNVVAPDLNSSGTGRFIFQNDFSTGSMVSHYGGKNAPKINLASSGQKNKYVVVVYQNNRVLFVGKGESEKDRIYILGDASPNEKPSLGEFNIAILTVAKKENRDDVISLLKNRFNRFALPVIIEYGNKIAVSPLIADAEIMICNRSF